MSNNKKGQEQHSSEEDESNFDKNTCSENDIEVAFLQYGICAEEAISLKKVFALKLSNDKSFSKISTSMSDATVQILNLNSNSLTRSLLISESENVCETKFIDENNLLVSSDDKINLYDLRINEKCATFQDKDQHQISCFDINCSNRMICAGTNQIQNDVFLLFFDIRQKKTLGGYWESHQDDITTIKFHPIKENEMVSGSTDGLINIFDLSKETEEEALTTTINTESSVDKLSWHSNTSQSQDMFISCITHTNDLKLYDFEGNQVNNFERSDITKSLKRQSVSDCNLINCHSLADDSLILLAGSNFNKGEILRSLKLQDNTFQSHINFTGNKQIVRSSLFDDRNNNLICCGEAGIVTVWSPKIMSSENTSTMKIKPKKQSTKSTPY